MRALLDKIELKTMHGSVIDEDSDTIDIFVFHLGAAPEPQRTDGVSNLFSRIFNTSPYQGRGRPIIVVRKDPLVYEGETIASPLFTGKLNTIRRNFQNQKACLLSSYLHLNPSRALNHDETGESVFARLDSSGLSRGLDGNDNIVPANIPRIEGFERQIRHIQRVYEELEAEFNQAAEHVASTQLGLERTIGISEFTICKVETYWEITLPEALRSLERMIPVLRSYHRVNRVTNHGERDHGTEEETEGNAKTVTLYLGNGEKVKIYAKQHDVLRIEVEHKPPNQDRILDGGYTAPNLNELEGKLRNLRVRAAERANDLLDHLKIFLNESPTDRAATSRYAARWFQRLGINEDSINLLEILRLNGRIIRGKHLSQTEKILVRRAKDNGLLIAYGRSPRNRPLYPAPEPTESD